MQKLLAALFCCGLAFSQSSTDWPNLARYHDDNAHLTSPAASENRVVFMGGAVNTDSFFLASHMSIAVSADKPRRRC